METVLTNNFDRRASCPFCLHPGAVKDFLVHGPDGELKPKKAHCPECDINMLMESLLTEQSAEAYAKWVFDYYGFWSKCNFKVWSQRLYAKGWASRFWPLYKKMSAAKIMEQHQDQEEDWEAYKEYHPDYKDRIRDEEG